MATAAAGSSTRVYVSDVLSEAGTSLLRGTEAFGLALIGPLLLQWAVTLPPYLLVAEGEAPPLWAEGLARAVELVTWAMYSVACHRIVHGRRLSDAESLGLAFNRRHWGFLGVLALYVLLPLLVLAAAGVPLLVLAFAGWPLLPGLESGPDGVVAWLAGAGTLLGYGLLLGWYAILGLCLLMAPRFVLAWPAISIDRPVSSLRPQQRAIRANLLRIGAALVIAQFSVFLTFDFALLVIADHFGAQSGLHAAVVTLRSFAAIAATAAVLSVSATLFLQRSPRR